MYPGVPMIYYGDEVGMTGNSDPNNRQSFMWGFEDQNILEHYKSLISLRKNATTLRTGSFTVIPEDVEGVIVIGREQDFSNATTRRDDFISVINRNNNLLQMKINVSSMANISVGDYFIDVFNPNQNYSVREDFTLNLRIPAVGSLILKKTIFPENITEDGKNRIIGSDLITLFVSSIIGIISIIQTQKNREARKFYE